MSFRSQITYSFVKCGCVQFIVFLTLSTLICRSTDISKCFSESLGIRDNGSRLYMIVDDLFCGTLLGEGTVLRARVITKNTYWIICIFCWWCFKLYPPKLFWIFKWNRVIYKIWNLNCGSYTKLSLFLYSCSQNSWSVIKNRQKCAISKEALGEGHIGGIIFNPFSHFQGQHRNKMIVV